MDIRYKVEINPSYEWLGDAKELGISHRELEVFALVIEGHEKKEIAEILDINHQSVKNHMHHFTKKLGVKNGSQAVVMAIIMNLIKWRATGGDISVELTSEKFIEHFRDVLNGKIGADDFSPKRKRRINARLLSHGIDVDKLVERKKE